MFLTVVLIITLCLLLILIFLQIFHNNKSKSNNKGKSPKKGKLNNKDKSITEQNFVKNNILIPNKYIDIPVYYINLDRSIERNKYIKNQFLKYGINNYKRVSAIDGNNIKKPIDEFAKNHEYVVDNIKFWNNYTNLNPNELACTLSHLNTIRTAYNDGHEIVLIIEDDANFGLLPYWEKTLFEYIDEFPKNWYCVSLFNMACYIEKKLPQYIDIKNKICNGSVAYIINRKGMESALETMNNNLLVMDKNHIKNHNIKSKYTSLADVFIFNRISNCYERKIPLILPYNDHDTQDSTIHTHHTWRHNLFANEIIKMYDTSLSLKDLK